MSDVSTGLRTFIADGNTDDRWSASTQERLNRCVTDITTLEAELKAVDALFPSGGPSRIECLQDLKAEHDELRQKNRHLNDVIDHTPSLQMVEELKQLRQKVEDAEWAFAQKTYEGNWWKSLREDHQKYEDSRKAREASQHETGGDHRTRGLVLHQEGCPTMEGKPVGACTCPLIPHSREASHD